MYRCVVSPEVREKLGLRLRVPIVSCQLDGWVAGGEQAYFVREPVEMRVGSHKELLNFIVALRMERLLLLGLTWVHK